MNVPNVLYAYMQLPNSVRLQDGIKSCSHLDPPKPCRQTHSRFDAERYPCTHSSPARRVDAAIAFDRSRSPVVVVIVVVVVVVVVVARSRSNVVVARSRSPIVVVVVARSRSPVVVVVVARSRSPIVVVVVARSCRRSARGKLAGPLALVGPRAIDAVSSTTTTTSAVTKAKAVRITLGPRSVSVFVVIAEAGDERRTTESPERRVDDPRPRRRVRVDASHQSHRVTPVARAIVRLTFAIDVSGRRCTPTRRPP